MGMLHYNAPVSDLSIEHRRAKPDKTLISNVSWTMNQRHMGNAGALTNPHRV
jgi:hypothetical protein